MSVRFNRREETPRLGSGTIEVEVLAGCTGLKDCLLSISITDGTCSSDEK
ncbi:hypothetical protein CY34DRAFT_814412 [Suillus luteus UH-Slu-Lm8-n1]|uniref:Uncharacterized protein n=1 Tax=Suillus luteus UH-Slu-Lm8-n1 TaxID=930992 RepID=A0A0D0AJM8_9AGAM|nr:hypothetical protein CY34DRAFT_814412 [Suillus luteus UH-Slu-Lm8-n1]